MNAEKDLLITRVTARLENHETKEIIGTAVIYKHSTLKGKAYLLTAAHCLFQDGDNFSISLENIDISFFNPQKRTYEILNHIINFKLVSAEINRDIAVLVCNLNEIEEITGELPCLNVVRERNSIETFAIKGFPSAADGREIIKIAPEWSQHEPVANRFQLHLKQDFSDQFDAQYRLDGFSGSGVFLFDHGQLYLYGIFTRFLDAGKLIYCQYISSADHLLDSNYLPAISYTFFGAHGLNPDFFIKSVERAIDGLGARFNAELNFRLPIAYYFNALTKDIIFRKRLSNEVDRYLTSSDYGKSDEIKGLYSRYQEIREYVRSWFHQINWNADSMICHDEIVSLINDFDKEASTIRGTLYERRHQLMSEEKGENRKHSYNEPFSSEISCIGQMVQNNDQFLEKLDQLLIPLSNSPILFITGDAGAGKSHLLGDIAIRRNREGHPALLILGQLLNKAQSVWQNILGQLGLSCTAEQFLETLNRIGAQTGSRTLLMIDAINEGAGKDLWHEALAGLLYDVKNYPHVGLVVSVRSTYWNTIIPNHLRDSKEITVVQHEGFRGNEYEAVKLFCEHYGITQPNFPLLNPEYANPLFLHLICRGIIASLEKTFPQGFQGFSKVFAHYTNGLSEMIAKKREEYRLFPKLVKNALEEFARACFENKGGRLLLEDAVQLFSTKFGAFRLLLLDLIEESVLIRSNSSYEPEKEFIYFSYERFGDFFIAEELLAGYDSQKDVLAAFKKGRELGALIEHDHWYADGILEAFAVMLPEKFGIEIMEVYQWAFKETNYYSFQHSVGHWLLKSLKWRSLSAIDDKKIVKWLNSPKLNIDDGSWFYFLFEICSVPGHPFNSDRMTRKLLTYTMAERDSFLQAHFLGYHGNRDDGSAYPITRIVDWAWRDRISEMTDSETARLVGQALAWILSSTTIELRDQATKAMVNLLQDKIESLESILKTFGKVNDAYVLERLYAIAFGCAVRCRNSATLKSLAELVYVQVFESGSPHPHIFLRDFARNTIEYAVSVGVTLEIDIIKVRPPYHSDFPDRFPSESEVNAHKLDEKDPTYRRNYGHANEKIIFSVLGWDFGRYIIEPAISHFEPFPFKGREIAKEFRKSLPRGYKVKYDLFKRYHEMHCTPPEVRSRFVEKDEERNRMWWITIDRYYSEIKEDLESVLIADQKKIFELYVLPQFNYDMAVKWKNDTDMDVEPIKRWIANRAFGLGYDNQLHGHYDSRSSVNNGYGEKRIERIGKKYQWIAFHEILGLLSDHYKLRDRWNNRSKSWIYRGPWDLTYRNVDPSFTSREARNKYGDDEFGILNGSQEWYMPEKYLHWNSIKLNWGKTFDDLPDPSRGIQRIDKQGKEWVYLFSSYVWKEPKAIGEERFDTTRKEIWYMFQAYFIPSKKFDQVTSWLKKQNFSGRWLPELRNMSNLLTREHFWSPISKDIQKDRPLWHTLRNSSHKVMLPFIEGAGSLEKDRSGAHFEYMMPNKKIFDTLCLRYSYLDGEFENPNGETVFSNVSPLGPMIRKDELVSFLDATDLKVVWTLLGEKNAFYDKKSGDIRKSISGVYIIEGDNFSGDMKITNW